MKSRQEGLCGQSLPRAERYLSHPNVPNRHNRPEDKGDYYQDDRKH
jgi:hypothetical protein